MAAIPKEKVEEAILGILTDMTEDWEVEGGAKLSVDTKLVGDLSFESIEIVQLMVTIEQHFRLKNLTAEKLLMRDGKYVAELSVREVVDFVHRVLETST